MLIGTSLAPYGLRMYTYVYILCLQILYTLGPLTLTCCNLWAPIIGCIILFIVNAGPPHDKILAGFYYVINSNRHHISNKKAAVTITYAMKNQYLRTQPTPCDHLSTINPLLKPPRDTFNSIWVDNGGEI